jgi:hypothetical protein
MVGEATPGICELMTQGFVRQEVMILGNVTSSRLAYLDRSKIIIPNKYGSSKKPTVIYTWDQLLQVRAIAHLKQKISLPLTQQVVTALKALNFDSDWWDKHLLIAGEEVYVSKSDWSNMPEIMREIASKNNRDIVAIVFPPIDSIISDIWQAAIGSELIDFELFKGRTKATLKSKGSKT